MLSTSNGDIWMLSTPCGKQGFFYETWVRNTSAQAVGSVVREGRGSAQADGSVVREGQGSAQAVGSVVRDKESAQADGSVVRDKEKQEWFHVNVTATDCPRISPQFLDEQRFVMGMDSFRQEHMCEFIGSGGTLFDRDLIDAAFDSDLKPL